MATALAALVPIVLTPGGLTPLDQTATLAASPLASGATGITFPNTGRETVIVQTGSGGNTTVVSNIGTTVQGQAVTAESFTQPATKIQEYGPYPSQFDAQNAANPPTVEIDFGTPANVTAVFVKRLPGVS